MSLRLARSILSGGNGKKTGWGTRQQGATGIHAGVEREILISNQE